jgi:hypothetical protein
MVRGAFVHGMDVSLVVAAGVAAVGILLALAFLPARATPRAGGGAAVQAASSVSSTAPLLVGAANEEAAAERGEVEHDVVA